MPGLGCNSEVLIEVAQGEAQAYLYFWKWL